MVLGYSIFSGGIERGVDNTIKRLNSVDRSSSFEPMFRFDSLKVKAVNDISGSTRQATTAAGASGNVAKPGELGYRGTVPNDPSYMKKIVDMQRLFLKNDGKLVWQKRKIDMPLYYLVIGLTIAGLGTSFFNMYKLANKKN